MEALVEERKEEVDNEKKIKAEIERLHGKQEELTASLIMNLGLELISMRNEYLSKQVGSKP